MEKTTCIRLAADEAQIADCKQVVTTLESSFEVLSNALNLAGNKVRLKILFLLAKEEELCVCDLSDILSMNISAVSQHLRKLKDSDLIKRNRKGQTIFYSLTPKYALIFQPFFELVKGNRILELV